MELKNHDPRYYIKESEFYNIFMVELRDNSKINALKLAKRSHDKNYEIVPIESVVLTRPENIANKIINISKDKIKNGETFTIKCNIRGKRYIKSKDEFKKSLYHKIEKLNGKTDDKNPDWIIHIEVVGENTGISVLRSESNQ